MLVYQAAITVILAGFLLLVLRNLRDYTPPPVVKLADPPMVSICIPARNEAENIRECVESYLGQTYPRLEVVVLDDGSDDDTGRIVAKMTADDGRLRLLRGKPLPSGWAGKCHACWQLSQAAQGDYLLLVDADTRAEPELLTRAMGAAVTSGAGMVSGFPCYVMGSFWEAAVLPLLPFLVTTLLPIRRVWTDPMPALCAACGQFELFRREAYCEAGGHAAIRASFHDGLQLARRVKAIGGRVLLVDVSPWMRCRMYAGGRAVWRGFTRNAYEGLGSFPAPAATTLLVAAVFLAPFGFLVYGLAAGAVWWPLCAVQVGSIGAIRALQARRFGGWLGAALHPLGMAALIAIQWGSWLRHVRGGRVAWRGRLYG